MASKRGRSSIAPHTEYAHTHVRCRNCGETVPVDATSGRRCERCVGEVA